MPKPKKLAPKKVGEEVKKTVKHHEAIHDEHGNIIKEAHDEIIEEVVDDIQMVYQEMTDDEIAELEKQQQMERVPTLEERVAELEKKIADLEKPKPK